MTGMDKVMEINTDFTVVLFAMFLVLICSALLSGWVSKNRDVPNFKESERKIKGNTSEKRQRNIIKLALVLILIVGLYPPWVKTFKTQYADSENPIGHHLIFKPPKSDIPPECMSSNESAPRVVFS